MMVEGFQRGTASSSGNNAVRTMANAAQKQRFDFRIALVVVLTCLCTAVGADVDLPTKFSNRDGIINTRHNLTQSTIGAGSVTMNQFRNDYGEVCVYCHTPHGADGATTAPLWNRTRPNATYTTYEQLGTSTLTQPVSAPGPNSLTCLSCHDGTLGVDSVINMPNQNSVGVPSGNYDPAQITAQNDAFLNSWTNASGPDATVHVGLNAENPALGCLACHAAGAGVVGAGATDFSIFAIGTDLRNDHPIGITYPGAGIGIDFNPLTGTAPGVAFFDNNGDSRPDTDEIRLYDTGAGPEVECASCHDPHGVPSAGTGSTHLPSFLRVSNVGSGVCLTCHTK